MKHHAGRARGLRNTWMAIATLLPLFFLSQCTCNPGSVNRGDINLISIDEEWRMGEQLAAQVNQEVQFVEDAQAQQYLEQMGTRIAAETELAGRPWTFHLVADPAVNAFALPGGHVYVNAGLVEAAGNASELAAVLAHEVAHGVARHGTERMTQAYGINALMQLVLGGGAGLFEQIAAQVASSGTLAKFSRDDEREADRLGMRFLHAAGYAPQGMVAFFETLLEQQEVRPNLVEQFFASHPMTEERVAAAREQAQTLADAEAPAERSSGFQQLQERVQALSR